MNDHSFGRVAVLCGGVLCILSSAGCGPTVGQVTGQVTYQETPAAAEIAFRSMTEPKHEFFGTSGEDGKFFVSYRTFRGMPVGRYKVTIAHHTLPGGKPLPAGEKGMVLKDAAQTVQHAYEFEQDIAVGTNTFTFELTKGKKTLVEP